MTETAIASATTSRYREFTAMSNRQLESIFQNGRQPDPDMLAGYEWRGFNTPFFARLLGIQKFIKGFFTNPATQLVEGYNIPVRQNGLDNPWIHKPNADHPKKFGYYHVYPVRADERDRRYPNALLLNYGKSDRNPIYRPERVLRDYIIQPDADNADLLIGKAYLAVGPLRIPSNFFILEKLRQAP
jgi:hypothetical protein